MSHITQGEMREVKRYFSEVLAAPLSYDMLQRAWEAGGTNMYIRKENELRAFMAEIIRRIDLRLGAA